MRIAALQFCPLLGDVAASIDRAERLLYEDESRLRNLDLLVLPELAFTGMCAKFWQSATERGHIWPSHDSILPMYACIHGAHVRNPTFVPTDSQEEFPVTAFSTPLPSLKYEFCTLFLLSSHPFPLVQPPVESCHAFSIGILHSVSVSQLFNLPGYNFPSLAAITPYLEPTASGPSTAWAIKTARRLNCTVAVGYPERALNLQHIYNSLVFVSASGTVLVHTRKSHLFYSDEVWAEEGPEGFFAGEVPLGPVREGDVGPEIHTGDGQAQVKMAAGICMDINPYQFTAPWTAYEFTTHARQAKAELVVLSCAWLTHIGAEDLRAMPTQPDLSTLGYWVERFSPLTGPAVEEGEQNEVILVITNRVGDEGTAERVGEVRYAGTSCVMGLRKGDERAVRIWDILGRAEEGVLVVDTEQTAKFTLGKRTSDDLDEDCESTEDD